MQLLRPRTLGWQSKSSLLQKAAAHHVFIPTQINSTKHPFCNPLVFMTVISCSWWTIFTNPEHTFIESQKHWSHKTNPHNFSANLTSVEYYGFSSVMVISWTRFLCFSCSSSSSLWECTSIVAVRLTNCSYFLNGYSMVWFCDDQLLPIISVLESSRVLFLVHTHESSSTVASATFQLVESLLN